MPRLVVWLIPLTLFACRQGGDRSGDHTAYLDHVYYLADSISEDRVHLREAFGYIDSVYALLPHPSVHDLCRKYDYRAQNYLRNDNNPPAEMYADSQLLVTQERLPDYRKSKDYYRALFTKGSALLAQHDYEGAFRCFVDARQLAGESLDICSFYQYATSLGTVCYRQRRRREAAGYFRESYAELQQCQDQPPWEHFCLLQGALDNIGLSYTGSSLPDSAVFFYDSARRFVLNRQAAFVDTPDHANFINRALGVITGNEGDAWLQKADTAKAIAAYEEGIARNMHAGAEVEDGQITATKLARLYTGAAKLPEAAFVLHRIRSSLDSFPHTQARLNFLQVSWQYNDAAGRPGDAFRDLLAYNRLKDSLEGGKPLSGLDVRGELQHISSDAILQALQRREQRQNLYLVVATVFAAMALIIIGLVVQNNRRAKRHVQALTLLNERVTTQNRHLHQALEALEQSHRDNDRMLRVLAHDLRNPIGASENLATLILEETELDDDHRRMLELIRTSARHSLDMITDLLRVSTVRDNFVAEPVDLKALLEYCAQQLEFKAEEKGQRLIVEADPVTLPLHREKIWRVVSNLVTNAIKFSHRGATITLSLHRTEGEVRISVMDEGIGIPDNLKGNLFDIPQAARRPGTAGEESFGLGLGISKQIVEALGGRIWFDTEEDHGTTFVVVFPEGSDVTPRNPVP